MTAAGKPEWDRPRGIYCARWNLAHEVRSLTIRANSDAKESVYFLEVQKRNSSEGQRVECENNMSWKWSFEKDRNENCLIILIEEIDISLFSLYNKYWEAREQRTTMI